MKQFLFSLLVFSTSVTNVSSFGKTGHYLIGESVWNLLSNETRTVIDTCNYRNGSSLGDISNWADNIKKQGKYRWTSPYHYYDIDNDPPTSCGQIKLPIIKPKINMITGIQKATDRLLELGCDAGSDRETQLFYFNLLVHLLQDMHQPLHLTGKDRGGNDARVRIGRKNHVLHSLWDTVFLEWHLEFLEKNYTWPESELLSRFSNTSVNCTEKIDFIQWANENVQKNCDIVYRFDQMDITDYVFLSNQTFFDQMEKAIQHSVCYLEATFKGLS